MSENKKSALSAAIENVNRAADTETPWKYLGIARALVAIAQALIAIAEAIKEK